MREVPHCVKTAAPKKHPTPRGWRCVLELDAARRPVRGSASALASAIGAGADLRVYTEFRHDEHVDPHSDCDELVQEMSDFRITYLLRKRWVAGIMNLRHPIVPPEGFGPRPSLSFFLYNQDGSQAVARPYLDGRGVTGRKGAARRVATWGMPKYHLVDAWDERTNAPSRNFVYAFDVYRFWVRDDWTEVVAHDAKGAVRSGSVERLAAAVAAGCEVKVALSGLCDDLSPGSKLAHEVFVHCGSSFHYTERKQFMAAAQPVVRVAPGVPLRYASGGWDFGWLLPRTDGQVARWLIDPYTLKYRRSHSRHALRWFVR